MKLKHNFFIALALLLLLTVAPVGAQETIADGLLNPRNLSYDADGNLYVAEAGNAGEQLTSADEAFGSTGRISMIAPDGTQSVVVNGLISFREGNTLGASAVLATDDSLWILLGETTDFSIPFTHALVELDKETGRVKTFVDLLTLELEEDPDGNANSQSNPTDFAVAPDGTVIIANAGCNCLMSWSPDAGLAVAAVWDYETDNPVPTAVEVDANGDIYVAFLTGFPWPAEAARIEKWSGGELVETYDGLNALTGLLVAENGDIYASEFGLVDGSGGPGRVVKVTSEGIEPVLEGLESPYGLAQAPDGTIVVSVGSVSGGAGAIVVVPTN